MSEQRPDYRPFLLFLAGPLGWLILLGWAVVGFVYELVGGLTGRLDDDDDDDGGGPPRRRYRRVED